MTYFYVTRQEGDGFVATLTLDEIRTRLKAGELKESFFATESDGRSFSQFRKSGNGRWRTLAELLAEHPVVATPPAPEQPRPSRRLAEHFQGGSLAGLLLGVGALTAALTCAAIPVVLALQLVTFPPGRGWVAVLVGVWSFCVSAAMVVVYLRALAVESIAADQDLENQRLWRAIEKLQSKDRGATAAGDGGPNNPLQPTGPA
ncbi:MAG: hypothetical protein O2931_08885 [Planctomycetota bacterium]|nr:hypothetical protein [Planctomycetota bacterium]MDA1178897.1 hypothetical protein [Planctomycetota bacterium]